VLIAFVFNDRGQSAPPGGSGDPGQSESQGADEDEDEDGGSSSGGSGETVEHDGMLFTVTATETTDEIGSYSPVGEYLIVHLDVAYAGTDTFWRDEQHVYTADGEQFEEDYDATLELDDSMWYDLPTDGSPVSMSIAFDVTSASDITHIGLSTETYGGNEIEVELSP